MPAFDKALLIAALTTVPATSLAQRPPSDSIVLPSRYDADRFFVRPVATTGDTLELFTDTGGGSGYLKAETVRRVGGTLQVLSVRPAEGTRAADTVWSAKWPAFRDAAWIPAPDMGAPGVIYVPTGKRAEPGPVDKWLKEDGFLGTSWFQNRIWTFDYPGRMLVLHTRSPRPAPNARRIAVGFKTDSNGVRIQHYPRIQIEVEGDTLDMLFDTGATTLLSDSAAALLADGRSPARATTFIMRSVFDRWRAKHPEWRVIARAEGYSGMDMIQVPSVTIAGFRTGAAWFTVRNDVNYRNFSRSFDKPIVGAIGGNALKSLRITMDFPASVAYVEQPR
jgi:hypothetical protein